jgi:regulator of ribonuclease activity A
MLAGMAAENGWSGFVIFGCIRDVDEIGLIDIGVQAIGINPMKTVKRGAGEQLIPVNFAGVTIYPNDYLYADNNGVVVSNKPLN